MLHFYQVDTVNYLNVHITHLFNNRYTRASPLAAIQHVHRLGFSLIASFFAGILPRFCIYDLIEHVTNMHKLSHAFSVS